MAHILVTGGAGYIGSVLVPMLLGEGHRVTVLDNFLYGQSSLALHCHDPKLEIVRGDVRDDSLLRQVLKRPDMIFPLACLTGAPICEADPIGARTINYEAIKLILSLRSKEQKIVFPTTNSGYGVGEEGIYCTEQSPLRPVSLYGKLKVQIEEEILTRGEAITLRLATVFGPSPRMRIDLLVNDFVFRALNDRALVLYEPHFKRNYLHVRDAAQAFVHCLEHFSSMKDQAYNFGLNEANISKWELCEEIKKAIPKFNFMEAPIGEDPDKRNYIVSNEKINRTGLVAKLGLQVGIAELIKLYQIIRPKEHRNY